MKETAPGGPRNNQEKQHKKIEIPGSFSEDARKEFGSRIMEQLDRKTPRWYFEKNLYTYLTNKISSEELAALEKTFSTASGQETYERNLERIAQEARAAGVQVSTNSWFSMYVPTPEARKKDRFTRTTPKGTEEVAVTHKEYFTVPIAADDTREALEKIIRFQNVLPALVAELGELGKTQQDQIQLKIPPNLQFFLRHPDSIVVHYYDKTLSGRVREIVEKHLKMSELTSVRDGRTATGFDFKSDTELYDGSHSTLMSSVLADHMIKLAEKTPSLSKASYEEIIPFLNRAFADYEKFTPQQMLERLDKVST